MLRYLKYEENDDGTMTMSHNLNGTDESLLIEMEFLDFIEMALANPPDVDTVVEIAGRATEIPSSAEGL